MRVLKEQGFDVAAPDMKMGLLQLDRVNSAVRQLLRLPELRLVAAAILVACALPFAGAPGVGLFVGALAIAWLARRRKALFAKAVARSFDACVAVARAAVATEAPQIMVGSSWGGAVAVELIDQGVWTGPTILLAPAVLRVAAITVRRDTAAMLARVRGRSARAPIVVFHDPTDETVPFDDSVELARDSAIEVRSVDAGGHRLLDLLERGELAEAIRALARPTSRG